MKSYLDFKLNLYFNIYKDSPLPNSEGFRAKFKKEHGNFPYLNELILNIINYQIKKYGETLRSGNQIIKYRRDTKDGKYKKSEKAWYI